MPERKNPNRRQFLQAGILAGAAAPAIVPSSVLGSTRVAPSDRITVGLIGAGGRGIRAMRSFLNHADVQVLAVCDACETHFRHQGKGDAFGRKPAAEIVGNHYQTKPCDAYADFRELCVRQDVDAVIIGTPYKPSTRSVTVKMCTAKNRSPTVFPKAAPCTAR